MPSIQELRDVNRKSTVNFVTVFTFPANNATYFPPSANLTLFYSSNGANVLYTAAMTNTANGWTASWDSSNADVGVVQWNIACTGDPKISQDGFFKVHGNDANFGGPVW